MGKGGQHEDEVFETAEDVGFSRQGASPIGISWTSRPDGWCDFISQEGTEFTGVPLTELLGYGWLDQVHNADRAGLMGAWKASLASGGHFHSECRIRRHDGAYHWFDANAVPLRGADGQVVQWAGWNSDIQAQREMREALRRQEEKFRLAAECSADVIYEWDIGERIQWYGNLEGLLGFSAGEFPQTFQWWASRVHPEDLDRVKAAIERTLREDIPYDAEYRIRRKNGDYAHWWARGKAVRDEGGKPHLWVGAITDITERKRAEERERLARETLELLNLARPAEETIGGILAAIQEATGLEAMAIRLQMGEDFPYFATLGFSQEFEQAERFLCAKDASGRMVRDAEGRPALDCVCGDVLCGRKSGVLSCFSDGGSFWTNSVTALGASVQDLPWPASARGRCVAEGYESVALVPLRADEVIIGLLQLNDHRRDQFTPALIRFFESLGASIGIALSRKQAEESQSASYQLLRNIIDSSSDYIFVKDKELRLVLCNQTYARAHGKQAEELYGKTDVENGWDPELVHGNAEKGERGVAEGDRSALAGATVQDYRELGDAESGLRAFDTVKSPLRDSRGEITGMLGISRDISERRRFHEELKRSEERYRSMFAANPEPICVYDAETMMILEANETAVSHYGFSREELLTMTVGDLLLPEERVRWKEYAAQPRPEFSDSGVWFLQTANGAVIEVRTHSHALTFQGRAARLVQAHDVTEERRTQRALLESEERFRRAVTQSPFPIMIHAEDGAVLQLSQSWCDITGYEPEELTTMGAWTEKAFGERRPQMDAVIETLYRLDRQATEGDFEIRSKAGAKRIWEFSSAPLGRLTDGRRTVISMAMDVTERRAAERELRELNRLLELLGAEVHRLSEARDLQTVLGIICSASRRLCGAEGATVALREETEVYFAEEDGVVTHLKGRRVRLEESISGWVMAHGISAVVEDIDSDPRVSSEIYDAMSVRSLAAIPMRVSAPLGAIACFWSRAHIPKADELRLIEALAEAAGVAIENVCLYAEMEKRVEERTARLVAANQELDAFAYSVSHDLRSPLRAMSGFSSALLAEYRDHLDDRGVHYLERIQSASVRMDQLIGDLLSLSRVVRRQLSIQRVEVTAMAEEIAAELTSLDPGRQVEFTIQGNMLANGDSHLLRVAFENLLANAWKFTGNRVLARIEVGQAEANGESYYFVRDNGAGFDMAYAKKLFAPFQRLHSIQEFPGTGIGLATVQRIVHRHGGRVWVEGEIDRGATIYFTLGRPE